MEARTGFRVPEERREGTQGEQTEAEGEERDGRASGRQKRRKGRRNSQDGAEVAGRVVGRDVGEAVRRSDKHEGRDGLSVSIHLYHPTLHADALEDIRVVLHVESRRRALALECAVRDSQDARVEPARERARVLRRDLDDAVDPFEEGELDRVRSGCVGDDGAVVRGRGSE